MIRVENLSKSVGVDRVPVLRDIRFDMQQGEMIAVVGSSGSGKSMLLKCLAMMEKWDSGRFTVDGAEILKEGWSENGKSNGNGHTWNKIQNYFLDVRLLKMY